ncbi:response regulator [Siphonobacter aquaeclarae]|jgi:CheY-like chemotaxis protein|uniref:Two-component system, unclassified family, response regulator n=1 Tax=Siphonobacter aquaeclarae TaxID=563176 RepID=A0A1G9I9D1_9BACT|nr:response regulator [Siphonobacter aquaeclarae]MBO9638662.1 response regulator [Siphonobacter aquaeclarae]SDL21847.1 two-component system, unclassified family, response regulator [Siphonobacter aquaeclarae]
MNTNAKKPLFLVVEDDPDHRFLLDWSYQKSNQSCHILFAKDGKQALELLDTLPVPPSMVLLDYHLPDMNGVEVLKTLRNSTVWKALPVLMLSFYSQKEVIDLAYDAGVNAFMSKPGSRREYIDLWNAIFGFWHQYAQVPPAGRMD